MASTNQRRVLSGLVTSQQTVTAAAVIAFASDSAHNDGDTGAVNARWLKAASGNVGKVFYGPAGVTILTGDSLEPGERIVLAGPAGAGYVGDVFIIGTANDIVTKTQF